MSCSIPRLGRRDYAFRRRERACSGETGRERVWALRIALIGHGAVASIHALGLTRDPEVKLAAVFGPDRLLAEEFARQHKGMQVSDTIEQAVSQVDLAIVCSPSALHYEQGFECLTNGASTLLEMPPCETTLEAEELAMIAHQYGAKLQCAHTGRYLKPYNRITEYIRNQELGEVQQVSYIRHFAPRKRGWEDDALLHHSAHLLDLLLYWFGDVVPKSCIALPRGRKPQSVSMLAELPNGAPASISVSYSSNLPQTHLVIIGKHHTVETDGFSYIRSDLETLNLATPERETYEQAICEQDTEFVRACEGGKQGIEWRETIQLIRTVNRFRALL
jgi:2-hydroxy-4-carboxymuconate semialdehyde hemiacetal dehydrogenase